MFLVSYLDSIIKKKKKKIVALVFSFIVYITDTQQVTHKEYCLHLKGIILKHCFALMFCEQV